MGDISISCLGNVALVVAAACAAFACTTPGSKATPAAVVGLPVPTPTAKPLAFDESRRAPAPVPTPNAPAPTAPALPPPDDDILQWNSGAAEVLVVTDAIKQEIEAKPDFKSVPIVLRPGAKDSHLAALVSRLPWLTRLKIEANAVTDLAPVRRLSQLQMLQLGESGVTTLHPLANHPSLEHLTVTCSKAFRDVEMAALGNVPTLRSLSLRGCGTVTSLRGLERLANLGAVSLSDTGVRDLGALAGKVQLNSLSVLFTDLTDLSPLAGLSGLRYLSLPDVHPADFSPLRSLTQLKHLDLTGTGIQDLSILSAMTELETLSLGRNPHIAFTTFPVLPKLQSLFLDHTNISDAQPLARCTALRYLSMDLTAVVRLSPLHVLRNAVSITVPEGVPDDEVRAARRALPKAGITRVGRALPEDPPRTATP